MKNYKVYMYTFPNGMIYIGMTHHTIQYRRDCGYQHNARLKSAVCEYGWSNVITDVLSDGLSYENACEAEQKFISEYNATDPSVGYNISKGGRCTYKGLKHSEEYKENMRKRQTGKVFSEKTKEKMRKSQKKYSVGVVMFSLDGNIQMHFESQHEAARHVGGHATNISRACKNGTIYKDYKWIFERG